MKNSTLFGAVFAIVASASFVAPAAAQEYRDHTMPRHERVYMQDDAYVDRTTTGSIARSDPYSPYYMSMNNDVHGHISTGDYYEGAFRPD